MNCPGHMLLFGNQLRSYRDLPLRYAESSTLHRNEPTGTPPRASPRSARHPGRRPHLLHARADRRRDLRMPRLRPAFLYDLFGMEARFELSTRPDNKLGTDEEWDFTEGALRSRPSSGARSSTSSARATGAFYGPKIDLHMLDVARPLVADGDDPARRADAEAVRAHLHGRGQPRAHAVRRPPRAARLARAVHGDPDRALRRRVPGVARAGPGARPPGRGAPPRARSSELVAALGAAGVRADADERDETLGKRIREAELQKIPYVVVWGDRETREAMAVRRRGGEGIETLSHRRARRGDSRPSADVVALANESPAATLRDLQAGAASPLTSPATGRAGFNRVETDEGMPPLHATAFPRNEEDRLDLVNCL